MQAGISDSKMCMSTSSPRYSLIDLRLSFLPAGRSRLFSTFCIEYGIFECGGFLPDAWWTKIFSFAQKVRKTSEYSPTDSDFPRKR